MQVVGKCLYFRMMFRVVPPLYKPALRILVVISIFLHLVVGDELEQVEFGAVDKFQLGLKVTKIHIYDFCLNVDYQLSCRFQLL